MNCNLFNIFRIIYFICVSFITKTKKISLLQNFTISDQEALTKKKNKRIIYHMKLLIK